SISGGVLSTSVVSSNQSVTITASYTYNGVTKTDTHAVTIVNSDAPDQYEPDNTYQQAGLLDLNQQQPHSINPESDIDWVKFILPCTSDIVIETSGVSGDTQMWLYDSNLVELESNDDGGVNTFSKIIRTGLSAGTYYIKVDEYGNNNIIPSYSLSLTGSSQDCGINIVPILYLLLSNSTSESGSDTVLYNDLMWQKTDDGIFRDWWDAETYCDDLQLGGYTDWRMPTFDELNSLVVCSNGAPTPPPLFSFLGCRDAVGDFTTPTMDPVFDAAYITAPYIGYGIYWTSTENGTQTDNVWIISFNYGQNAVVEKIEDSLYIVRCVRDL
ncbi:pre-peptidase C-terminal domain-containing protein, partial [Candidatus Electrothrix marina]